MDESLSSTGRLVEYVEDQHGKDIEASAAVTDPLGTEAPRIDPLPQVNSIANKGKGHTEPTISDDTPKCQMNKPQRIRTLGTDDAPPNFEQDRSEG